MASKSPRETLPRLGRPALQVAKSDCRRPWSRRSKRQVLADGRVALALILRRLPPGGRSLLLHSLGEFGAAARRLRCRGGTRLAFDRYQLRPVDSSA